MSDVVIVEDLWKRYPKTEGFRDILTFWRRPYMHALRGVTLNVQKNRTLGILGPNGAGKTSLLKILAGLVLPDQGRIEFNGVDVTNHPERIRERLMYVYGEERTLNWRLTARQNLDFWAPLFNVPHKETRATVEEVLEVVGLTDMADERVMKYSTGMRHRVIIARGLLAKPQIFLLDEPTRSLDPVTARKLWTFIKETLVDKLGTAVIVATHDMEEATFLCDDIVILQAGQVRAFAPVDEIASYIETKTRVIIKVDQITDRTISQIRSSQGVQELQIRTPNGRRVFSLELLVEDPDRDIPPVVERLTAGGSGISRIEVVRASLGDIVVKLTEETSK